MKHTVCVIIITRSLCASVMIMIVSTSSSSFRSVRQRGDPSITTVFFFYFVLSVLFFCMCVCSAPRLTRSEGRICQIGNRKSTFIYLYIYIYTDWGRRERGISARGILQFALHSRYIYFFYVHFASFFRTGCSEYQLQLVEGDQMLHYEYQFGPDSAS